MPRAHTNYLDDPHWNNPRKVASRLDTIIQPYRQFFGDRLPADKQYWTMCGAHYIADENSIQPIPGEFGQMVETGLITDSQFHGVDRYAVVIENNRALHFATHPDAHWHHGDFKDVMEQSWIDGEFRPAIINYDGVMEPKYGVKYLKTLLRFIDHNVQDELLFTANFVMRSPYRRHLINNGTDVIDGLMKSYAFPDHWTILPQYYEYLGGASTHASSIMGVFVMIKRRHSELEYTARRRIDGEPRRKACETNVLPG